MIRQQKKYTKWQRHNCNTTPDNAPGKIRLISHVKRLNPKNLIVNNLVLATYIDETPSI